MLDELLRNEKKIIEPVEVIVPTSEVINTYKSDAISFIQTTRGILFKTAALSYWVFVERGDNALYLQMERIVDLKDMPEEEWSETDVAIYESIIYLLQAPLFATVNPQMQINISHEILSQFNAWCNDKLNAVAQPESIEDIEKNKEMNDVSEAIEHIVSQDMPEV